MHFVFLILRKKNNKNMASLNNTNTREKLSVVMSAANIKIFFELTNCFLRNPFAITTRGLARYSHYCARQIFRFLSIEHNWYAVRILLFLDYFYHSEAHYLAAIDETVVRKSGKSTHGKDYFYSSIVQNPIPGVCFFNLSLIDPTSRTSYMLGVEQVIYTEEDKKRKAEQKKKRAEGKKRNEEGKRLKAGRKKGEPNKKEPEITENASFRTLKKLISGVFEALKQYISTVKITHLLADSAYAAAHYMAEAQEKSLFLISKLNKNAVLYSVPEIKKGKGRPTFYGEKIDLHRISEEYLVFCEKKGDCTHKYYQFKARNKSYKKSTLNVLVVKTENAQGKISMNILFSNDLNLDAKTLFDYYSLRFQIEFDFRDAKQYFGLSDFKNYKEKNITSFVNLSFTMTLVVKKILADVRKEEGKEKFSILDLKLLFHGNFQAQNLFFMLKNDPTLLNNPDFERKIPLIGYINVA